MKKILIILIILFFAPKVFGASVFVSAPEDVNKGEVFEVSVLADTDGIGINTAEVTIDFDESILEFQGYKTKEGIISMWVEAPKELDGRVSFAGVIPGGASGVYDASESDKLAPLVLAKLLFFAKDTGEVNFYVFESSLLKHDGLGTEVESAEMPSTRTTIGGGSIESSEIKDTVPPESFEPIFINSSFFSKTPQMIIFEAKDIDSGIKRYEIRTANGKWKEANSPYVVRVGFFDRKVAVRAYDHSGNFTESYVAIPGSLPLRLGVMAIGILILAFFCVRKLIK